MIKRINHIKNFGVFQNYRRTGDIHDFANLNIIYGWNYSGKTTISRIFQHFERTEKNPDYSSAEFEIENHNGDKFNEQKQSIDDRTIRTFNADFIKNNLKWDGSSFDPIQVLLLGEDSIEAEKAIKEKTERQNKYSEKNKEISSVIDNLNNAILDGLSNKASQIKTTLHLVSAYTRAHIKPVFDEIKTGYKTHLLSNTDVVKLLPIATASDTDKLPVLTEYIPTLSLTENIKKVKELVKQVPKLSKTIDYFVQNPEIANWVEKGLPIHQEKSSCEFCGNTIEQDRITDLMAHFSEDLKNHKASLTELIETLSNSKISIPTYTKRDFYKDLWTKFNAADDVLKKNSIKDFNKEIESLIKIVETKFDKPFGKIEELNDINDNTSQLEIDIKNYNKAIISNTEQTNKFDTAKKEAIVTLKKHYTAEFIDTIELSKKESKISRFRLRVENFTKLNDALTLEINVLEADISQAQKGREEINKYISQFLGRDEIKVEVIKESDKDRFTLKRENSKAKNLSEGEKTAIAFSFFLTKLKEIKDFDKTIVYIDDPISSLDSNHIFQVNAILKSFFFSNQNDDNAWKLKCKQLFVSTHNFDFFTLLKELPTSKNFLQKFFYQVRRINKSESVLEKLPKSLQQYSSEYHFLFEELYNFNKSADKGEYSTLMGIPNAVRRFVELYTYSRLPGNSSSTVDQRADILWGEEKSKRILKVLHYFSHANNIDRMIRNSDLICDIEDAVADLMVELKEDEKHYAELKKALKN
ncbi:MAG: wobble nucleotide-excising tRNase [Crocinitomicaceae bacterium]|jgi:wobble nucleotide-excising tRNase